MRLAVRLALASMLTAACATSPHTTAPDGSAARTPYRLETLAFEAPSGFTTRSVPAVDAMLTPRGGAAKAGAGVLTIAFCADGAPDSCGGLAVRASSELSSKKCADREQVRLWLRLEDGHDMYAARYANRDGWLVGGESEEGYSRVLVLCDRAGKLFQVKAVATGAAGVAPAKSAFELFLKTVRIETPELDFTILPGKGS